MKSFFVVLLWLVLGFFFWSMSQSCCKPKKDAELSGAVVTDGVDSTDVHSIDTSITSSETVDTAISIESETSASVDYDYESDHSIKVEKGISNIPLMTDNPFSDEIKAHLEQFCASMQNDLSKIHLQGYDAGDKLARETSMDMENFLIRCGISPGRIVRMNRNTDSGASHVKIYLK